jgi:hypothetical protein
MLNGNRWRRAAPGAPRYLACMRRAAVVLILTAVLAAAAGACADVRSQVSDGVEQLRGETQELSDRARFCLAVTRVATAIESGSPATAQEAAEELLAQAPDDLAADTQAVVTELRRVLADDEADLRDAELRAAIDRLSARTLELCDPS